MKLPAPLEKDIQATCLQLLAARGVFAWRTNSGAMTGDYKGKKRYTRFHSIKGVSDIIGIMPGGRFLAVEVKRPGNKPSDDQRSFLDCVNRCGGLGIVVYSAAELDCVLLAEKR